MNDFLEILLRVALGFAVLLFLVRIIGNKQLGQLNVFTYISGIVIGSMIGDAILHKDLNIWRSILGLAAWVGLLFFVETVSLKSVKARELLDGQPIILIKKGQIMYDSLKKERMNIDDLTMMLRTNKVFSILDVDYAILESNGDLSVLKKQEKDSVAKEDLNLSPKPQQYMPTSIIIDGRVIVRNLVELDLSKDWLHNALNKVGIQNYDEILYAELQKDAQLYMQLRNGDIRII